MAKKMFVEYQGLMIDVHSKMGHEILLSDLKSARNYSYEATMSDYSMATINHAAQSVKDAEKNLIAAGYEIPEW